MTMVRRLTLLLLLPALAGAQWLASPEFEERSQRGIQAVYNLEFERAESEFRALAVKFPSHPAGRFFLGMIEWWRILIDMEDESRDDLFIERMDDVIDLCDSLLEANEHDVTALFFKGGALGFRGRLRANRSNWITAANDGRRALPIVQRAYAIAPENADILLGIGIYNYYAATIPERYPIVKPVMVFFPEGDKRKGVAQLETASREARYAAIEATYFLLQLNYNYEREFSVALALAESLFRRFPDNVLFQRYIGRCEYVLSRNDRAAATFEEIVKRCGAGGRGYGPSALRESQYYLGLLRMQQKRYDDALRHFYECDRLSRTLDRKEQSGFMISANLRVGMIYDLQKRRALALRQYEKVEVMRDYEGSRDMARRYRKEPFSL